MENDINNSEIRLMFAIAEYVLNKKFKIIETIIEKEPFLCMKVKFSSGIVWRCLWDSSIANQKFEDENEEIVIIKHNLINTDIGKSTYEVAFFRAGGDLIFKSIETISPLKLIFRK